MAVSDAHVLPGFLTPVLTVNFLSKAITRKKVPLNRVSNSQPTGRESDTHH